MSETQGGLAKKLAKILADVERVPKNGRNDFHNYDYVTEADLLDAIRPKLAKAGVFVFSGAVVTGSEHYETKDGKTKIITTVKTTHTFMDGDTGETHTVECVGQGEDAGDKGAYKAITGASKYFWMKNFMVSTGDDPENTGSGDGAQRTKTTTTRKTTKARSPDGPANNADKDLVSEKQGKRMYALSIKAGWSADELHKYVRTCLDKAGREDGPNSDPVYNVTWKQDMYQKMCEFIEGHPKEKQTAGGGGDFPDDEVPFAPSI